MYKLSIVMYVLSIIGFIANIILIIIYKTVSYYYLGAITMLVYSIIFHFLIRFYRRKRKKG